ncbi:unnamed protein product [Brachionus calyciflorus]|uniref:Uncharacterized protein n=1 Tax=Brachionus calyciflorus TaxID=104777 RepID=A0A813RJ46_9BILA|nr:unnamed protein product [Brachionus calyciflorus]
MIKQPSYENKILKSHCKPHLRIQTHQLFQENNKMQNTYESESYESMFNSAFINQSDIPYMSANIPDLDISNCFLDLTSSNSLDRSLIRCAPVSTKAINYSSVSYQSVSSSTGPNFSLSDSCLLFTTDDNIQTDLDQLTNVSEIQEEGANFQEIFQREELTETKNDSMKISCKNVVNYIMRPITNKIIKKINKKFKTTEKHEISERKVPVKLYSSPKQLKPIVVPEKVNKQIPRKYSQPKLSLNSNSLMIDSLMNNNFVKCGDLVTYFV